MGLHCHVQELAYKYPLDNSIFIFASVVGRKCPYTSWIQAGMLAPVNHLLCDLILKIVDLNVLYRRFSAFSFFSKACSLSVTHPSQQCPYCCQCSTDNLIQVSLPSLLFSFACSLVILMPIFSTGSLFQQQRPLLSPQNRSCVFGLLYSRPFPHFQETTAGALTFWFQVYA